LTLYREGIFEMSWLHHCSSWVFNCRGCELWAKDNKETPTADPKTWPTIMRSPDFGQYLGENRVKEFQKLIPCIWENPSTRDSDPWWEFLAAV
jgi:hypothetical protein